MASSPAGNGSPSAPMMQSRVLMAVSEARIRMHLRRLLADVAGVTVVGHVRSGAQIVEQVQAGGIDIVIVDAVENPLAATEMLQATSTQRVPILVMTGDAPFSLPAEVTRAQLFSRPLNLETVLPQSPFCQSLRTALLGAGTSAPPRPMPSVVTPLRSAGVGRPALIAIGSSTGGPAALPEVLRPLGDRISQPIVITQHMPAAFSQILVEHLGRHTSLPTVLATDGMPVLAGRVHVAPGGYHLLLVRQGEQVTCRLNDGPPESFCKPAVDPMLRSIIAAYGGRALAVILTGMGQDGLLGCRALVEAGGTVLAQDEATSVVWGMPKAVAQAGICQAVLPLRDIAQGIVKIAGVAA